MPEVQALSASPSLAYHKGQMSLDTRPLSLELQPDTLIFKGLRRWNIPFPAPLNLGHQPRKRRECANMVVNSKFQRHQGWSELA
jgi:hypothetical protein